jgi:ubiquinone/menaquinone biosynthesis C-methylase UbiE
MSIAHASGYTAVDSVEDPAALATFMDIVATCRGIDTGRRLVAEQLGLGPGSSLLDLGCGTGEQTRALATRVAPGGRAVGVDLSQSMIGEARRRAGGAGVAVEFEVGDAQALPFADGTFDACRSERMLTHVPDPRAALAEMVRVCRPGGRVAVLDADSESMIVDSDDRRLARQVVASFADSLQNGRIGRQLARLMTDAGLTVLTVEPHIISFPHDVTAVLLDTHLRRMVADGALSDEMSSAWLTEVIDRAASPVYMTLFAVVGVRERDLPA